MDTFVEHTLRPFTTNIFIYTWARAHAHSFVAIHIFCRNTHGRNRWKICNFFLYKKPRGINSRNPKWLHRFIYLFLLNTKRMERKKYQGEKWTHFHLKSVARCPTKRQNEYILWTAHCNYELKKITIMMIELCVPTFNHSVFI